ncbi:MAG: hypothetical protein ACI9PN_000398, partial [Candidatus Azotimanducaceae bacterium]
AIDLSGILNVYGQTISVATDNQSAEASADVLASIVNEGNRIKIEQKALDRFIDLGNLNLNQIELNNIQISELVGVVRSDAFSESLTELAESLDESLGEGDVTSQLKVASAAGIVVGISTGILSQVLRAGALLASFMSVVPLWRQFDPLPILSEFDVSSSADDRDNRVESEQDNSDEDDEVEEIFDRRAAKDA